MNANDILEFWFEENGKKQWWQKSDSFDQEIRDRFMDTWQRASVCEFWTWRETTEGRLAEIIVLDQFPRNMFRDDPRAFSTDPLALALSQEAVATGALDKLGSERKPFLIMPYMHSESAAVHEEAMRLFSMPELEDNLDFERRHKAIIDQFGRYPHRNEALGRISTPEELEFLKQPGSRF